MNLDLDPAQVTRMEESLWAFAEALDSDYVHFTDLVAWADQQVLQLESPPRWLLELCLAKSKDEALGALLMERNRFMETISDEWPDPSRNGDLHMGFLYLRFEQGELTMASLLELAGQYADAPGYSIDCETFYYMLNEIDGGGPTFPSDEPLEHRVARLFGPMAAFARLHLGKLPATNFRAP